MPELIARLSAVCREHLLREKILVVPSLAIGHQIADAVAHGGTPWVNLRMETIRTIADAVALFPLAQEGMTVLSRAQALALIERACDQELDDSSYFAALADRPGLHRAIQKSIDDLRHAGIDPTQMKVAAFEDSRKASDLARILGRYEEELKRNHYIDRFGVLARAIAVLQTAAPRPWSSDALWLVVEDTELTSTEDRLLRAVTNEFELIAVAEATPRNIDFRRAIGDENELRGAIRSVLSANLPFDQAEIVYTTRDPYLPLAYELASEYDIPCTFAEGVASHFTRPGQAALAFFEWIGKGWRSIHLQVAARAGAIATPAFARILRRARIGWGRERYLERLDVLMEDKELSEKTRTDAIAARVILAEFLAITADIADGETVSLHSAARSASAFVERFALVRNEADAMARAGLRRMLAELGALETPGDLTPLRSEVAARLSDAVRNLHVAASNPRPGFLHVAPIRAGGWSARSRLFVIGLDESRHPGAGLQDPILLDVEREAIGIPIVGDRPIKAAEQLRRLLWRASSRTITLSYASTMLRDRRERFPSSDLLAAYRTSSKMPEATYHDVASSLSRAGFVDERPLSGGDWWLRRRFIDGGENLTPSILAAYPNLDAGAEATAARASDSITAWDGRIEAPPDQIDPRVNERIYSASQLETMASCPYRYFLERILRVRPLDDLEFEPDTWLEAREFGTLLHAVLQSAMNELCENGTKPSLEFLPRLEAIAHDALRQFRREVPPPSEAAFQRRADDLLEACEIFLRTEEQACQSVTPRYFEVSFGSDESDGIAMPEPLQLSLGAGRSVKLRGRIDRVDRDDQSNEWHVWDYKSGGTFDFDRGGQLRCGTKIQHAIYARAVEAMLARTGDDGRVSRSGYLFPTRKGRGARLERQCTDADLKEALNLLFDVVGRGFFPHASAEACRFCDYKTVCGGASRAAERMENKLAANAGDDAVSAWLRLQAVR